MCIQLSSLDFEFPNGTKIFENLNLSLLQNTKYGLVGPNGIGKSTLARIITGEIKPTRGRCILGSKIYYLPQEDTREMSDQRLSGGEQMQRRLKKALSSAADFIIFDEPTNNLDRANRNRFLESVRAFTGGLLIISHDRELLETVDVILELSNRGLSVFGSSWSFYEKQRLSERERLFSLLRRSRKDFDKFRSMRTQALLRQEKRERHGKSKAIKRGLSRVEVSGMKRTAQKTSGNFDKITAESQSNAEIHLSESLATIKVDPQIYAEFPRTEIPKSKLVFSASEVNFRYAESTARLWQEPINHTMRGPSKLAICGDNGVGKSTFLKLLTGRAKADGEMTGHLQTGNLTFKCIDQTLSFLDSSATVLENVMSVTSTNQSVLRNSLAQFLFFDEKVHQITSTLSGGEKLRLALAMTLLSDFAPQLLILDEPTNNIDITNLEFLEAALMKYRGALIVVSHDDTFLENVGAHDRIHLTRVIVGKQWPK